MSAALRIVFSALWVWLLSSSAGAAIGNEPPRRPHIVLIMADDMGYECVGANGGTSYRTPHLDRLAKTGLRFEHCHSQPLCTPTRVQLMTGIYNDRNYIRFGHLDPKATTFAHLLKKAGYATCVVGKWQLEGGLEGPKHFGFDEYCLWQLSRRPPRYANPGLEINGKVVDFENGEYGPDLVNDYLCEFIERRQDQPFFAYYPMILPHAPFVPTPDSVDWDPVAKGEKGGRTEYFADMVAYVDKMVGKVIAKLELLGLREQTVVIFTCDNGTGVGVRSHMDDTVVPGGKGKTIDYGTHVPLIVSWPGVTTPGVCRDLVDSTDFLPTLLEVAGLSPPDGLQLDGRSFAPQLRGESSQPRSWIFAWYERNGQRAQATRWARTQRYKLYDDGRFVDVAADPQENAPILLEEMTNQESAARAELQTVLTAREKYK